jgi:hypothetical protein
MDKAQFSPTRLTLLHVRGRRFRPRGAVIVSPSRRVSALSSMGHLRSAWIKD